MRRTVAARERLLAEPRPDAIGAEELAGHGDSCRSALVPGKCIGISTVTTEGWTMRTNGSGGTTLTVWVKVSAWPSRLIGLVVAAVMPASTDSGPVTWTMSGRAIGERGSAPAAGSPTRRGETRSIWVFSRSRRRDRVGLDRQDVETLGSQDVALVELNVERADRRAGDLDHHVDDVRCERPDLLVGAAQAHLDRLDRIEDDDAATRVVGHRRVDQLLAHPLALHERRREPDGDRGEDGEQAQSPGLAFRRLIDPSAATRRRR